MTAALPAEAAGKPVEIGWQDAAGVGQQGRLTRLWDAPLGRARIPPRGAEGLPLRLGLPVRRSLPGPRRRSRPRAAGRQRRHDQPASGRGPKVDQRADQQPSQRRRAGGGDHGRRRLAADRGRVAPACQHPPSAAAAPRRSSVCSCGSPSVASHRSPARPRARRRMRRWRSGCGACCCIRGLSRWRRTRSGPSSPAMSRSRAASRWFGVPPPWVMRPVRGSVVGVAVRTDGEHGRGGLAAIRVIALPSGTPATPRAASSCLRQRR